MGWKKTSEKLPPYDTPFIGCTKCGKYYSYALYIRHYVPFEGCYYVKQDFTFDIYDKEEYIDDDEYEVDFWHELPTPYHALKEASDE